MAGDEKPTTAAQGDVIEDDDTEGHSMLQNMGVSRQLAQARERDIQQHLKRHDLEAEARTHKKDAR